MSKWRNENSENQKLYEKIRNNENIKNKISKYNKIDKKAAWQIVESQLTEKGNLIKFNFIKVMKYAAAILSGGNRLTQEDVDALKKVFNASSKILNEMNSNANGGKIPIYNNTPVDRYRP